MGSELRTRRRCSVLYVIDTPIRVCRAPYAGAGDVALRELRRPFAVSPCDQRRVHRGGTGGLARRRTAGRRPAVRGGGRRRERGGVRADPHGGLPERRRSPSRWSCRAGSSSTSSTELAPAARVRLRRAAAADYPGRRPRRPGCSILRAAIAGLLAHLGPLTRPMRVAGLPPGREVSPRPASRTRPGCRGSSTTRKRATVADDVAWAGRRPPTPPGGARRSPSRATRRPRRWWCRSDP